ncbi:MAG: protein phosphatase 2C domain-containing protein [Acidobacteriota bacterium]
MRNATVLVAISALTDPGIVRANNEDSFLLVDLASGKSLPDNCQLKRNLNENRLLLAVSDGVGGSQLGELASELTVLSLKDAMVSLEKDIPIYDRLTVAVEQANHVLWTENIKNQVRGMKATVTAFVIEQEKAYIASVGDSRAYIIRKDRIKQLTTDQTLAGVLISRGMLNPEDIEKQPRSNMILQAIGNSQAVQVAVTTIELRDGDYLLLCTDGLTNKVNDQEICQLASYYSSPEVAVSQMVALAKQRGGEDNITVVLAKFEAQELPVGRINRLTGEVQQINVFDPYAETQKTQKRTALLGNSSNRRVGVKIAIEVRSVNSEAGNFAEQCETLQLSKVDASFLLNRSVNIDDLLHISLPMPRELRLFDLDEPLYQIYVQVRKISRQANGNYLVRVAFISKDNPENYGR